MNVWKSAADRFNNISMWNYVDILMTAVAIAKYI